MKKLLYIIFYFSLIWYEIVSMNNVYSWQLDTESKVPVISIFMSVFVGIFVIRNAYRHVKFLPVGKYFVIFYGYLYVVAIIHGLINGFDSKSSPLIYIMPLICFFVEYYAQHDSELKKARKVVILLFFAAFVVNYLMNYNIVVASSFFAGNQFVETNTSYYLLYITPILCCVCDKKYHKYIFIAVIIAIIMSNKRGGFLGLLLGILLYYYIEKKETFWKRSDFFGKSILFLFMAVFVFCLFVIVDIILGGSTGERLFLLSEDEGSGRTQIYEETWQLIMSSGTAGQMFGHGFNQVKTMTTWSVTAHNDILEIIYDFGWICAALYMFFIISGFRYSFKHSKDLTNPVRGMSFGILAACMMVSIVVIRVDYFNLLALFWGASSGTLNNRQ